MKFAKWVFLIAGIYGLAVTIPQFFSEASFGRDYPPAVTHPEFYYGFAGLCLAWQVVFLVIGSDVRRYRPLMLVSLIEKFSFVIAVGVLHAQNRVPPVMVVAAGIDALLGVLFAAAWWATGRERVGTGA